MTSHRLREGLAMSASEEDIKNYLTGPLVEVVTEDTAGRKSVSMKRLIRSKEQARYAYADAVLAAKKEKANEHSA